MVSEIGRRRSGPRAVYEGEGRVEANIAGKLQRGLEIGFRLAGKADDEIGGQADVRPDYLEPPCNRSVFQRGIAAFHCREHAIGTRLHGEMYVGRELWQRRMR